MPGRCPHPWRGERDGRQRPDFLATGAGDRSRRLLRRTGEQARTFAAGGRAEQSARCNCRGRNRAAPLPHRPEEVARCVRALREADHRELGLRALRQHRRRSLCEVLLPLRDRDRVGIGSAGRDSAERAGVGDIRAIDARAELTRLAEHRRHDRAEHPRVRLHRCIGRRLRRALQTEREQVWAITHQIIEPYGLHGRRRLRIRRRGTEAGDGDNSRRNRYGSNTSGPVLHTPLLLAMSLRRNNTISHH